MRFINFFISDKARKAKFSLLGLAILLGLRLCGNIGEDTFSNLFIFIYTLLFGTHAATDILANKNKKEEVKQDTKPVPEQTQKPEDKQDPNGCAE